MVKEYEPPRTINRIAMWLSRLGLGPTETLITRGRRTGQDRSVPVTPINVAGTEYLVSPYGEVSWVHNAREHPEVALRKGGTARLCRLVEVTGEGAEVVKAYWDKERFPRPYMDVPGEATVEDFASVASRFPVFRVEQR